MAARKVGLQLARLLDIQGAAVTRFVADSFTEVLGTRPEPWWCQMCNGMRGYKSAARRRHHLSVVNKSSQFAIQPFLEQSSASEEVKPKSDPIQTGIPTLPVLEEPLHYHCIGRIVKGYQLHPQKVFAVVEVGAHQFKVTASDIIYVDQLKNVDINDVLALDRVMLLGSQHSTIVGRPYVPNARVLAAVEEHFKDGKIVVFKKKRRKRYTKRSGSRAHLTGLRILEVTGVDEQPGLAAQQLAVLPIQPLPEQQMRLEAAAANP